MPCRRPWAVLVLGWFFWCASAVQGADAPDRTADEAAIRQRASQYLAALEKQDAKAFESFWLADGDIIDPWGRSFGARDVIGQSLSAKSDAPRPEIRLLGTKVRFLSDDVALEDGVSEVLVPGNKQAVLRGRFTTVWVKRDGQWWLASLRESSTPPPTPQEQTQSLDGLVGDWVGQRGDKIVEIVARWSENHAYLLRDIRIYGDGNLQFSASQRIGWDPQTRTIKSWTFDADGGHGEGTWTHDGNAWSVVAHGVLPDGRNTHSTNAYIPDGKDRMIWKSFGEKGAADGAADIQVTLERKPAENAEKPAEK